MSAPVFISWMRFHGRSEAIAERVGAASVYTYDDSARCLPLRYLAQWRANVRTLRERRPDTVLVMQPPVLALLATRWALGRRVRIVADLHTGAFLDPKWAWSLPLVLALTGKHGLAVVTNEALAARVRRRGYPALVLHDPIEVIASASGDERDASVLLPFAWASDEPVQAVLDAARLTPEIEWRLTGTAPAWVGDTAPDNVRLLGFVPDDAYWTEFARAGVVGALTTKEHTMQRAGYEALCRARPVLTAPTAVLREYYGEAVVYAEPTAQALADGARRALAAAPELEVRMATLRTSKIAEQDAALDELRAWLSRTEAPTRG